MTYQEAKDRARRSVTRDHCDRVIFRHIGLGFYIIRGNIKAPQEYEFIALVVYDEKYGTVTLY